MRLFSEIVERIALRSESNLIRVSSEEMMEARIVLAKATSLLFISEMGISMGCGFG